MRKLALLVALLSLAVAGFTGASASAAPKAGGGGGGAVLTVPITGTFTDALGGVGTVTGSYTLQKFTTQGGVLAAAGTLTATLTDSLGTTLGTVTQQLTIPVSNISGTCQILHLELGPLDLNLLGLMVHLDKVVLDITAQSGPGNLLGNLLCGIAGLLDQGVPTNQLANLLNQLLALLR
jgi:hypothetical protein